MAKSQDINVDQAEEVKGLGTFGGVFTPSILTILGVIMYLRFGWVVGNVGLMGTLIIVTVSTLITFLTSLSIASVATNRRIKIGGAYFMISRSLGIETGGAVGIPLFIAQTLSASLYTIGFAESFVAVFPFFDPVWTGVIVTVLIGIIALISANVAIKTQYFILGAIGISLISLLFGSPLEESTIEMWGVPQKESASFWRVFAVFFPAVTGIMAGVNMSGDLKDPAKSIPKGTFLAVGTGYLIYMALPIILASRVDAETLVAEPLIMRKISFWGDAILLGVWGATLSSALGSMLGAPRILQAMARDRVLPRFLQFLGKGSKSDSTPRYGTFFTLAIAVVAVIVADLDLIAPVLTMFFLTTYGVLNISSAIENFLGNPSFRPKFRVAWVFSFAGAFGCIVVMILINALATSVAALCVVLIFIWLQRRKVRTSWGDVRQGIWMSVTKAGLLNITKKDDPKNWYPHFLVLSGAPTKRWHLIALTQSFARSKGLMTVASVLPDDSVSLERQQKMEGNVRELLLDKGINCLVRIVCAPDPFQGAIRLVESYGIGNFYPNTYVLGNSQNPDHQSSYCKMIRKIYEANRNTLIIRDHELRKFGFYERIDIWWAGLKGNGALMILLGHLINKSPEWSSAQVYLKFVADEDTAAEKAEKNLDELIKDMRIGIKKEIIKGNGRSFYEILHESSKDADLVMLGLKVPDEDYESYLGDIMEKTEGLPSTVFVLAGQTIDFKEVLQ